MKAPIRLIRRAVKLWPKNKPLQREWLRAIHVVRQTSRGWRLDNPVSKSNA